MKMRNFFWTGLVLFGLMACSDDLKEGEGGEQRGDAYLTVKFSMPNDLGGRAGQPTGGEEGDGEEEGFPNESEIKNVCVVLYEYDEGHNGTLSKVESRVDGLTKEGDGYILSTPIETTIGEKSVYVILNSDLEESDFPQREGELRNMLTKDYEKEGAFMMSNADYAKASITADNKDPENPGFAQVSVARIVGKLMYKSTDGDEYIVKGSDGDKVKFKSLDVVNLMTDSYLFRRVGQNQTDAVLFGKEQYPSTDYVIDPIFDERGGNDTWFTSQKYKDSYTDPLVGFEYSDTEFPLPVNSEEDQDKIDADGYKLITYCLENTAEKSLQKNGNSTGLIFKAVYTPSGFDEGKTFYRYKGLLYKSWEDLKKVTEDYLEGYETDIALSENPDAEQLEKLNTIMAEHKIDRFKDGVCYYTYWIKHANSEETMGVMEFAIVRNNVYKMSITSVSSIGTPEIPDEPGTDDEKDEAYLNIDVKILPWTLRYNAIEF